MDRPNNPMVINTVLLFEAPLDWPTVREIHQTRLVDRFAPFRRRVVELPLLGPHWTEDTDFALEHHLHHLALPAPGDDRRLQELVADLMAAPLDRRRPLWHTYVVDGYGDGAAIISRVHHCVADGTALARVLLSLVDPDAADGVPATAGNGRDGTGMLPELARRSSRLPDAIAGAVRLATSPSAQRRLLGVLARDGGTALRLLLTPSDSESALKGDPGLSRRVAWTRPLPLAEIKRTARRHGATVNDVALAAVAGALRHYLQAREDAAADVQALVPVNLRSPTEPLPPGLGNRFGLVLLALPVGTSGALPRLELVHRRMQEIKASRDARVSYGLLSAAGHAPERLERMLIDLYSGKGSAVMTNVIGPQRRVRMAGSPVRAVLVWAPTSGHLGMSVSVFSYAERVTVGLMTDATRVPDPDAIVDGIERELESLASEPIAAAGSRGR